MSAAEDYKAARAQLRRIVAQGGRRISLVEFTTLPQLREIIDELHAEIPGRPFAEVEYDPLHTTAPEVVRAAQQALENKTAGPLPLLVLRPRELRATPEDERAAYDFWQAMNFRRELLGQLPAQILLCVDPWHHRWLVNRAADLWSWLMPKFHLIPPPDFSAPREESLGALSSFTEFHVSPEVAEKQWHDYWPLLEKKTAEHSLRPGDFRRLVFPLFEGALAMGNLVRARKVRAAANCIAPPIEDEIEWHKLNGQLGCGAGDFSLAEEHARKLLDLAKDNPDKHIRLKSAEALTRLANLLGDFGQADAAEFLHGKIIAVAEKLFGPEHPNALAGRNNLANALYAQGKHAEAEKEHRAVLAIRERVQGAEHSDILKSRNNLANVLRAQGKHAEAEKEHRAVLAIRERMQGAEHPDVFQSCFNLALCLENQGKLKEALEFAKRAEEGWKRVLGAEHPNYKKALALRQRIEAKLKAK